MPAKVRVHEALQAINDILDQSAEDPGDGIVALGECLIQVGRQLKGRSVSEAKAIIKAVEALRGVQIKEKDEA